MHHSNVNGNVCTFQMYNNYGYPHRDMPDAPAEPPPPPRLRDTNAWSGGMVTSMNNQQSDVLEFAAQHYLNSVGQGYPQVGAVSGYNSGTINTAYTPQALSLGSNSGYGLSTAPSRYETSAPSRYETSAPSRYETSANSSMSMSEYVSSINPGNIDGPRTPPPPMLRHGIGSSMNESRRIYETNPVASDQGMQRYENGRREYSQETLENNR